MWSGNEPGAPRSRRSGAGGPGRSRDRDIAGLERRRPRSTDIFAPDLLAVRIELSFRTRGSRRRRVATRADLAAALVFASSGAGADAPSAPDGWAPPTAAEQEREAAESARRTSGSAEENANMLRRRGR